MEVILNEDFPSLGYVGDRVNVRRGYARNFLIPRGIAMDASLRNERLLKHRLTAVTAKRAKLRAAAEEQSQNLSGTEFTFTLKVGRHGKTFGSVTAKDIAAKLAEKGFVIDRKRVKLAETIKKAGDYSVEVKLHAEVAVALNIKVIADRIEEEKRADEAVDGATGRPAKGKGKSRGRRAAPKRSAAAASEEEGDAPKARTRAAASEEE